MGGAAGATQDDESDDRQGGEFEGDQPGAELTRCNDGGASGSGCEDQGDVDGAVPGRSRHWSESSGSAARPAARRPIWRVLSSGPALQRQAPSGPPGRQSVSTGSRAGLRAPAWRRPRP